MAVVAQAFVAAGALDVNPEPMATQGFPAVAAGEGDLTIDWASRLIHRVP